MPTLLKDDFKAWIDRMPGSPQKLIVVGGIEVNTGGWTAMLVPKVPQGINPNVLLLDVQAIAPQGIVTQVINRIPLRFEETPPRNPYTQVTVFEGTDQVTVDVGATQ